MLGADYRIFSGLPRALVVVVGLGLFATSCTVLVKSDAEQCVKDEDCAARGADFLDTVCRDKVCQAPPDPVWGCVGHVAAPPASGSYQATLSLYDLLSGKPVTQATVGLCNNYDPPCSAPVRMLPITADGLVTTTVAPDFKGFFFIKTTDDHLPTLYFIDTLDESKAAGVALLTPDAAAALDSTFSEKPPAGSGALSITITSCDGRLAAGVHFDIASLGANMPFYAVGGAISTTVTVTDAGGGAGFAGLQEGTATITATLVKTHQVVARASTLIRYGSLTYLPMSPTPLE